MFDDANTYLLICSGGAFAVVQSIADSQNKFQQNMDLYTFYNDDKHLNSLAYWHYQLKNANESTTTLLCKAAIDRECLARIIVASSYEMSSQLSPYAAFLFRR
uniref:Uncharacterized protein n=1 Tax=Globodera rostochiensis TaxID=31243 RepID=A0A914ICM8_GLORO